MVFHNKKQQFSIECCNSLFSSSSVSSDFVFLFFDVNIERNNTHVLFFNESTQEHKVGSFSSTNMLLKKFVQLCDISI